MLTVGTPAPDFELPDQHGNTVRRSDYLGRLLVIYFYPKDGSPACTRQACGLRDHWENLGARNVAVLGISPDDIESHSAFADAHRLPQTLLADPDRVAVSRYDVWGEKVVRGTTKTGLIRSTFLVDQHGVLADQWRNVDPDTHADQVLSAVAEVSL